MKSPQLMNILGYLNISFQLAYSPPLWAALIASVFVIISLTLSMYLLFEHLSAYKNPEVLLLQCFILKCCLPSMHPFYYIINSSFPCLYVSGAKVFDWSYPNGSMLCSRISKLCELIIQLVWVLNCYAIF